MWDLSLTKVCPPFYQVRKARCVPLLQEIRFKTGTDLSYKYLNILRIVLSGNHLLHNTFGCCEKIIGSDTKEHLVTFCNRLQIYKLLGKTEFIILVIGLEKGGKQGRTPIYYVCRRSVPLFTKFAKQGVSLFYRKSGLK